MRARPYQSREYQNKQRINQPEKFDSAIARGESFKLKLWKDGVFALREESTFAVLPPAEQAVTGRDWHYMLTGLVLTEQGFPSHHDRVMFSKHSWSWGPAPKQQNECKRVAFATASCDSTEGPESFRVPLLSWDRWLKPCSLWDDRPCI